MILSNKLSINSKGINSFVVYLYDLANQVSDDGGVDKNQNHSLNFYFRVYDYVVASSMSQVKPSFVYAYDFENIVSGDAAAKEFIELSLSDGMTSYDAINSFYKFSTLYNKNCIICDFSTTKEFFIYSYNVQ